MAGLKRVDHGASSPRWLAQRDPDGVVAAQRWAFAIAAAFAAVALIHALW